MVEQAVRSGELSEVQAHEISSAAAASPKSQDELLEAAKTESVAELKQRCARVRAAATFDELARYDKIRARRRLRHYRDFDGAFRLDAVLTPDAGALVLATLEPYVERVSRDLQLQGRRESREAMAADALVAMAKHAGACDSEPVSHSPRASVQVMVDHSALVRGSVAEGETCEIKGVGPVPVSTARALSSDAFLTALSMDGADVRCVAHFGRTINAQLRRALEVRDPECVVPGCYVSHNLEIDHIQPLAEGGPTTLDNLARLCSFHHFQKTHRGYRLSGRPGWWKWEKPPSSKNSRDFLRFNGSEPGNSG